MTAAISRYSRESRLALYNRTARESLAGLVIGDAIMSRGLNGFASEVEELLSQTDEKRRRVILDAIHDVFETFAYECLDQFTENWRDIDPGGPIDAGAVATIMAAAANELT